jgi:hypothetical protein
MLSKLEVINSRKTTKKPTDSELRKLPYKNAYIYGRVSSPGQVRDSKESIREIARLVSLAKEDGYKTQLDPVHVEVWLDSISAGTCEKGVLEDGQVTVDVRDLGLSGQLYKTTLIIAH